MQYHTVIQYHTLMQYHTVMKYTVLQYYTVMQYTVMHYHNVTQYYTVMHYDTVIQYHTVMQYHTAVDGRLLGDRDDDFRQGGAMDCDRERLKMVVKTPGPGIIRCLRDGRGSMFPVMKRMDAVHSGTGVFYQAMPAVGADGKNIMKLIPVKMVDGQFVQAQMSKSQSCPAPQSAVHVNASSPSAQIGGQAAWNSSATQVSRHQVGLDQRKSTVPANSRKSMSAPSQLPVTVKSPALPRGQYLQIPPDAQIRTVPASELPPGIKEQILISASSSPGSGVPRVVYVSPVTTLNHAAALPNGSALHSLLRSNAAAGRPPPSKGSKRRLKLIPKVSQRPDSPTKWVIEEDDSSAATTRNPLTSSEIRLTVAQRQNGVKSCDALTAPASPVRPAQHGQVEENALVMCNGKVFFVAKKGVLPGRMAESGSLASSKGGLKKRPAALQPVTPEVRQDVSILIPDESDEVIDLCDDEDDDDGSSLRAAPVTMSDVTHLDEDNVIFVSYIPPKSKSVSEQDVVLKTQLSFVGRSSHTGTRSLDRVTGQRSPDGAPGGGDSSPLRGQEADQSVSVSNFPDVCGSAGMKVHESCQPCTSTQHLDTSSGVSDKESSLNPASVSPPKSHPMSDRMLRQMFSIAADVKVCLQRIDEASAVESKRSAQSLQKQTRGLWDKECLFQAFISPGEMPKDRLIPYKPVETVAEPKLMADPPHQSRHTHTAPLKCSHFTKSSDSQSETSLTGTSHEGADSALCYVEPIDEDFLSTDENDIPNSQDTDTQTGLIANTRMGRTRKRTMCPCCTSGSQGSPVAKPGAKTEQPVKWTWTTAKMSKKGGRIKTVRKTGKTPAGISSLAAKGEQECRHEGPDSDGMSTSSMDSEELKQRKSLLREKEAASEVMRRGLS
ncbi:ligand-dependent nuclear receptor-interacting factor 1 [Brachionichthys hirsutus]|uniref:ligand-dependent nuclear receptor-interacting factor 1 n=1 Tax=Brachionichthys hirsutus TaxID=412623 RepID=UPI003604DFBE